MNKPTKIKTVRKEGRRGKAAVYHYDKLTGRRILGEYASDEFMENLRLARSGASILIGVSVAKEPPKLKFPNGVRPTHVYFLQAASGPVKIGFTINFDRRKKHLSQGVWDKLRVLAVFVGDRALEKRLHRIFAAFRIKGEWYRPHSRIFEEIECLRHDATVRRRERGRKLPARKLSVTTDIRPGLSL